VPDAPDLAASFRAFASEAGRRAQLYVRLAALAAAHPEVHTLLEEAPVTQRRPVLLFAAIHHLVLGAPDSALARHYPSITGHPSGGDPERDFIDFVLDRRTEIRDLVATRSTQTNEVGRSSILLAALWELATEGTRRIGLLDVGCSAGLNLALDRYHHRFVRDRGGPAGAAGGDDWDAVTWPAGRAPGERDVRLECSLRGLPAPVPHDLEIVGRLGIDPTPIDITDPDESRWLEACVWPDQLDRLERLRNAVAITRIDPPPIRRVDAVRGVGAGIATVGVDDSVLPVVVNTWVLAYLDDEGRRHYAEEIDRIGAERDLTWIYAEAPDDCPGLDRPSDPTVGRLTCVMQVDWRAGRRSVRFRGASHPHGYWLHRPTDPSVTPGRRR
jgi:hypothetical protein